MSHTEPEPSDVLTTLTGLSASLTFDGQRCLLKYSDASSAPPLLRALGERQVPVSALQRVDLTLPSSAGLGALRLVLRSGVDPVLAVVGDKPHDALDPYFIQFYQSQQESALRLRSALEQAIAAAPPTQVPGFLLPAPPPPRTIRGADGIAEFDGRVIKLSWRFLADEAKTSGGPTRAIPLSIIERIEWSAPSTTRGGHLRITVAGCNKVITDIGKDPDVVLLPPGTEGDSVLFVAAVRVALAAPPGSIIVHRDTESRGDRDFTGIAERDGEQVGCIHAHTPDGSPHLREIGLLVTSASEQEPNVTDTLLAKVLRWASMSGARAVTWWVTDWPEHREEYERRGFGLVGKWRSASTGDRRMEEWQIRAALRPDPQFWQGELLDALGDVAPRKPGWRYVLRSLGVWLMFTLAITFTLRLGIQPDFDQWPHLGNFSLAFVVVAAMLTAFAWPVMRAVSRAGQMSRAKTATKVLRKDPRSPVLYLRSFQDDKSTRKATRIGSLITEEQAVASIVADIGPFISLGRADRVLGAARAEVADADWRPAVVGLLAHARLVVFRCGTGESLFWELEQAVKILRPEQLLILVPADDNAYRQFRAKAVEIMPHALPELPIRRRVGQRLAAAICFSPGWHPQVIPLRQSLPLRLMLSPDTSLALKLNSVLRRFTRWRFRFWLNRLGSLALLVAVGLYIFGQTSTAERLYQSDQRMAELGENLRRLDPASAITVDGCIGITSLGPRAIPCDSPDVFAHVLARVDRPDQCPTGTLSSLPISSGRQVVCIDNGPLSVGTCIKRPVNKDSPPWRVGCEHPEAFGRVVGLVQMTFLSPNCPDETDDILSEHSSSDPLGKVVCVVALNGPHPGAPGEGGGILRVGDCVIIETGRINSRPIPAAVEVQCGSSEAQGRVIARVEDPSQCPATTRPAAFITAGVDDWTCYRRF